MHLELQTRALRVVIALCWVPTSALAQAPSPSTPQPFASTPTPQPYAPQPYTAASQSHALPFAYTYSQPAYASYAQPEPSVSYTGPLTAKGSGFKVGPFVCYKLALPAGLTVAAQIGFDYLSLKGLAKDGNGNTRTGDAKTTLLLADAGLGWSF